MEKELKESRNLVNKIVKNLNRNDLDWTVQISISSVRPDKVYYSCQIEAPANGLQPITWVFDSYEKLHEGLKIAVKSLNAEEVEKAWHKAEIERAEALIKYHKESLKKNEKELEKNK